MRSIRPTRPGEFLAALLRRNFVFTSATVPAAVLAAVGGYDESLALSEEYDLWLRILVAGSILCGWGPAGDLPDASGAVLAPDPGHEEDGGTRLSRAA